MGGVKRANLSGPRKIELEYIIATLPPALGIHRIRPGDNVPRLRRLGRCALRPDSALHQSAFNMAALGLARECPATTRPARSARRLWMTVVVGRVRPRLDRGAPEVSDPMLTASWPHWVWARGDRNTTHGRGERWGLEVAAAVESSELSSAVREGKPAAVRKAFRRTSSDGESRTNGWRGCGRLCW